MRVVDRTTFLALPAGTFYCKGVKWVFSSLSVKGDTLPNGNDWYYLDPAWASAADSGAAFATLERSLETGASFACEDAEGRDGCFDEDAVFLIFEKPDLLSLRCSIDAALANA